MTTLDRKSTISWYRSPVSRETLDQLNRRSDLQGFIQTLGHLGMLMLTGATAWYSAGRWPFPVVLLLVFLHGTFYAFLLNGFHEFCHKTVFRTKGLNTLFLNIFSFMGCYNPVMFWASHQEHHKYTLHPPDDMEVLLPVKLTLKDFLKGGFVNPWGFVEIFKLVVRLSRGQLKGDWENALFPPTNVNVEGRRRLFTWARIMLFGHATIIIVSIVMGWWMLPVLTTFAPYYGGWLLFLCNNAQHIGLQDDVPDYRLCCRTIILHPFISFLYWRMNYHTEHHMYAAVPCYNLAKLHDAIKADLPHCPVGLVETWKVIRAILAKQKQDPTYEYAAELPAHAV